MRQVIQILVGLSMYTFILTSMLGSGLGLTINEVIEPLRKTKLVILALLANFLLIPAIAYLLTVWLKADPSLQAGLIILACCAGAPFLPRLALIAKGDLAFTIGHMVLLMVATVAFAPLFLPFALPGTAVNPWAIARPLVILMLLPLALGLIIREVRKDFARLAKPLVDRLSSLSLIAWIIFALFLSYNIVISAYGTGIYKLAALFTVMTLVIGFAFSGWKRTERFAMMLNAGARNIPAALVIAATNFTDHRVVTVVLIGSLVQFVALFILARLHGRYEQKRLSAG